MDIAYVSAFAALGGSMVGGLISGTATWLAQRSQVQAGYRVHLLSRREDLFRDFIRSATKAYGQAMMSNDPNFPDIEDLYGMLHLMQAVSLQRTVECAEKVVQATLDAYVQPNKTFSDMREMLKAGVQRIDALGEFAEAAREELRTLVFR
jgi:hypothetical protein